MNSKDVSTPDADRRRPGLSPETSGWFDNIPASGVEFRARNGRSKQPGSGPMASWFVVLDRIGLQQPAVLRLRLSEQPHNPDSEWLSDHSPSAILLGLQYLGERERALAGEMLMRSPPWTHSDDQKWVDSICAIPGRESWYELVPWLLEAGRLYLDFRQWGHPGSLRLRAGETYEPTAQGTAGGETTFFAHRAFERGITAPWGDMTVYVDTRTGVIGRLPRGWTSGLFLHLQQLGSVAASERRALGPLRRMQSWSTRHRYAIGLLRRATAEVEWWRGYPTAAARHSKRVRQF